MAGENEASGATQSEATQGDPAVPAGAVAAEAGAGADAASDARAEADRARDEYIAQVAAEAATRAVEAAISRLSPAPAATAATPPTVSHSAEDARYYAEHDAIERERARLNEAFNRDGYTNENVVAHSNLTAREARFIGQVNLVATKRQEQNVAIAARGNEPGWDEFARAHPDTPMDILRDAFDARQAKAAATGGKPAPRAAVPARPSVNVSAPGEVSAGERKARTMTREQANTHQAQLQEDDPAAAAKFARERRNGGVIIKG